MRIYGYLSLCCLLAVPAFAGERACVGAPALAIQQLQDELDNCKVDMPEDVVSTADMNNAHYDFADCSIAVAHKIFADYYKNNVKAKENFDNLVRAYYDVSHDLVQGSDHAKIHHTGTMYGTMAVSKAGIQIKELIQGYIDEIKLQCNLSAK